MTRQDIIKAIADFWGEPANTAECLTNDGLRYELRGMEKQGAFIAWAEVDRILN